VYVFLPFGKNTDALFAYTCASDVDLFGDSWSDVFFVRRLRLAHFLMKGVKNMADYKSLYFQLFNKLTDVIEELKEIQAQAEEAYLNTSAEDNDTSGQ